MINIAIFASGAGTNAENIIRYFSSPGKNVTIALIVCNKPGAGVLKIAERNKISILLIEKGKFCQDGYFEQLVKNKIEFIVLAGFLWKLPPVLINNYPRRIINIHPALLPKYGGRGMYGQNVHEAVINNQEKESGISIHYVDAHYDNGDIIFQAKCAVLNSDTPESLTRRIHELEYAHYPIVIEDVVRKLMVD